MVAILSNFLLQFIHSCFLCTKLFSPFSSVIICRLFPDSSSQPITPSQSPLDETSLGSKVPLRVSGVLLHLDPLQHRGQVHVRRRRHRSVQLRRHQGDRVGIEERSGGGLSVGRRWISSFAAFRSTPCN